MASSLSLTQTRSLYGNLFRVVNTVNSSVVMPPEVFVFATADQSYNRIASVQDLLSLPNTHAAAVSGSVAYYRLAAVTRDFTLVSDADRFAKESKGCLKFLAVEYDSATTKFIGTDTGTISS